MTHETGWIPRGLRRLVLRSRSTVPGKQANFSCPACREQQALTPFEKRSDINGFVFDIWQCMNCHLLLNATHLPDAQHGTSYLDNQANSSNEFYAVDDAALAALPDAIAQCTFFDHLFRVYPQQRRGVALDFGAGQGIIAGAAARYFDRVYAAELSLTVLSRCHEHMPLSDKIVVTNDYKSIPDRLDCVATMHTLEHLPQMREILDDLVGRMNAGGTLFYQVPLMRKDYLINVHYSFFNEASARALSHSLRLETIGVWFDHGLDFLTCIARKP